MTVWCAGLDGTIQACTPEGHIHRVTYTTYTRCRIWYNWFSWWCAHGCSKHVQNWNKLFFLLWHCDPTWVMASSFFRFLDHTQRRTTVGRTPLDEWSARRRDLYLTTHDIHNRQISMPPVGFESKISAGERPAAPHLLRSWVRIPSGHGYLSVVSVVCFQVEVSATSWSLVQRSPTDCGASLCVS